MNALKPRPPLLVLVMSEESRLGREQIETAYALKQITDAGVRVFFYLEDRERTLDSAMDKDLGFNDLDGELLPAQHPGHAVPDARSWGSMGRRMHDPQWPVDVSKSRRWRKQCSSRES